MEIVVGSPSTRIWFQEYMNSLPQMWIQSVLVWANPIFIKGENPKQSELGGWNRVNEIDRLEYEAPLRWCS